ncbi:hypothetical protein FE257_008236 [Aspergillus nanangensis]|uniref:SMI1/KNR4 family protein n=1 Tax=Aspergillus nanangensis TaxID=2582783 RepID=A0AAD4GTM8_ASPNN|nr:hypothetical protein FE257_008236 [Aspergillus nanangensis]
MTVLTLPKELREVFSIGFEPEYNETGESIGVDFEPYEQYEDPEETSDWFRMWTGNEAVDGSKLRMFGSTGSGDYAGFWLTRPNVMVVEQPVVFLGSEGEHGVIARDLADLLWIFANGSGPMEALENPGRQNDANQAFHDIAQRYAANRKRSTAQIVADAQREFPDFKDMIASLIR